MQCNAYQVKFSSIIYSCESPELLMTMSTTDIPVLHYVEVTHLYPQDVFPMKLGLARPLDCHQRPLNFVS
jgi:hypothetical protein